MIHPVGTPHDAAPPRWGSRIAHVLLSLAIGLGAVLALPAAGAPDPYSRAKPQSGGSSGRQLVDQLYTPAGGLPIRDMIVEVAASDAIGETGNLMPSGTDRIYYKYPNRLRVDTVFRDPGGPMDGKQAVIIRDGTNRWMFISMGQYPVKKGADEPIPTLNLPYAIQTYPQDTNSEYRLAGAALMDGVRVEVVEVVAPGRPDSPTRVWIDPERRVPIKLQITIPPASPSEKARVKQVHYKEIKQLPDGRYLPHRLEIYEGDALQSVRVYQGVKINVGLQDSLFEPMSKFVR